MKAVGRMISMAKQPTANAKRCVDFRSFIMTSLVVSWGWVTGIITMTSMDASRN